MMQPPSSIPDLFDLRMRSSVAEPHHLDGALAPGKISDAATAPAPTLLHTKPKYLKQAKVDIRVRAIFSPDFFLIEISTYKIEWET
jgi:hypothetical protein